MGKIVQIFVCFPENPKFRNEEHNFFISVERCQRGNGVGGSENKLSGLYSRQQCIEAVRLQFPKANGFTFGSFGSYGSCGTECECYAEFDMTDWDNKRTWESCKFSKYNLALPHCKVI